MAASCTSVICQGMKALISFGERPPALAQALSYALNQVRTLIFQSLTVMSRLNSVAAISPDH